MERSGPCGASPGAGERCGTETDAPAMRAVQNARSAVYSSPARYVASCPVSSLSGANRPSGSGSPAASARYSSATRCPMRDSA
ncbi:hypothetical protein SCALM49S_06584 [Streptomyces californicus]